MADGPLRHAVLRSTACRDAVTHCHLQLPDLKMMEITCGRCWSLAESKRAVTGHEMGESVLVQAVAHCSFLRGVSLLPFARHR